ncbi:hypothetical protein FKP32DRAFT_1589466 [Trametes sanguinea]|nr:hypothetical protein FKP32DRAFT_1589466 [Trametes sanguinea]
MSELPPEIIDRVLDYLHGDFQTLASCALAARVMVPAARYHRFNSLNLSAGSRISKLIPLLDASPDLARTVSSVRVKHIMLSSGGSGLLSRLPSLQALTLFCLDPYLPQTIPEIVAMHPHLAKLCLTGLATFTPGSDELLRVLSLLKDLRELSLDHFNTQGMRDHDADCHKYPSPPQLYYFGSTLSPCALLISRWIHSHTLGAGLKNGLRSFQFFLREPADVAQFDAISAFWASKIQHLDVLFAPIGSMPLMLFRGGFALSDYEALESCHLRFQFEEMCVEDNYSLNSIPEMLSRLYSRRLRTVTLSLVVDCMEDLRSVMSENAVRDLSPAYFDDMRVFNWPAIEKALTRKILASLQTFVVEGRGSPTLLQEHIRKTCPDLHARSLVSLVAVQGNQATK